MTIHKIDRENLAEALRFQREFLKLIRADGSKAIGTAEIVTKAAENWLAITDQVMEWQPIETAPKDGTAILVCYGEHYEDNGFLPVCVRWRSYHPNALRQRGREAWRDSSGHKISVATHWMPLPKPPTMIKSK